MQSKKYTDVPAIILGGGFGTRLRPLSFSTPKHLLPVLNEPMIIKLIKTLQKQGIKNIVLACGYGSNITQSLFKTLESKSNIYFSNENEPLGTGGAVKKALSMIPHHEKLYILNGDVFSEINFQKLYEHHITQKKFITISLKEISDVSGYGVVKMKNHDITEFIEKPSPLKSPSNFINAGIYLIEKNCFTNQTDKFSIEIDLFPKYAKERKLSGYLYNGLWLEFGNLEKYKLANFLLLKQHIKKTTLVDETTKIDKNVIISSSIIGKNVTIDSGCVIKNSLIMDNTILKKNVTINDSIIGNNVELHDYTCIGPKSVIADRCKILPYSKLGKGVLVCPSKTIKGNYSEGTIIL